MREPGWLMPARTPSSSDRYGVALPMRAAIT
jgi:hypothetical protein